MSLKDVGADVDATVGEGGLEDGVHRRGIEQVVGGRHGPAVPAPSLDQDAIGEQTPGQSTDLMPFIKAGQERGARGGGLTGLVDLQPEPLRALHPCEVAGFREGSGRHGRGPRFRWCTYYVGTGENRMLTCRAVRARASLWKLVAV